jgi:diguanylate cyclase (GGDEF)-like protein
VGAKAKALFIVSLLLSAATISYLILQSLPFEGAVRTNAALAAMLGVALIAFAIGLAACFQGVQPPAEKAWPLSVTTPPPQPPPPQAVDQGERRPDPDKQLLTVDRQLLPFVQDLLASTTSEGLRAALNHHLPALLVGRRVWISSDPAFSDEANREPLVRGDVEEWTTFRLRQGDKVIGLLGVESAGGLSPALQITVQRALPLIAQALSNVRDTELLREASLEDLLTGAATRREGLTRLQAEIKRAQRTSSPMAVLMVDLDHFKAVNDKYGHGVGDALLTALGRTMQRTLRASDVRCRWGGEEFLIVLPDADLARAQVVANHLLQTIATTVVSTAAGPVSSTASIGLTISRPGETNLDLIVRRADMALYRAKNAGRSCVRVVLGDPDGNPIGTGGTGGSGAAEPVSTATSPLPFPDRRNPTRTDRRGVPGPGRRSTDVAGPPRADSRAAEPLEPPRPKQVAKQAIMPSAWSARLDAARGDD